MKRKFVSLLLIAILLCTAFSVVLIGCDPSGVAYSVTVLMPDETTPVEGITVSWLQSDNVKGSAVTNANGKAEVKLPSGSYKISLSGLAAGLTYTSVTVTESMNNLELPLENVKVRYSATVIDKNGNPAKDVTVMWMKDKSVASSVKTNAAGVAACELAYGEYTVSVSATTLPDNNIYNGTLTADAESPNVQFNLVTGKAYKYSVTVVTAGGLKYPNLPVVVYQDGSPICTDSTDKEGVFGFDLPDGTYEVEAQLPDGYTGEPITVTADNRSGEIVITSSVIMSDVEDGKKYLIGDVINDFKFTTAYDVDGAPATYSIAELLKTKKAVFINNWGITCTYCDKEMGPMQEAYEQFKDDIEIIALDNYQRGDSDSAIIEYRETNGLTFPMMRDVMRNGAFAFPSYFNIKGWPTTIVIDRYGVVAHIESGAILATEVWVRLINRYIGDDYVQNFEIGKDKSEPIMTEVAKPDIELPANHYEEMAAAINKFPASDGSVEWFGETLNDTVWPFLFGTEEQISPDQAVLYASNAGKPNSWASVYAKVKTTAGKVLTFDYYADTEVDDVMSFIWDGNFIIKEIAGSSDGWKKCYLYTELTDDEHTLVISYIKDFAVDVGKDNVYIRNVHFEDFSALEALGEPTDYLRGAAYGAANKDDEGNELKGYTHYAKAVLKEDGFYHVVLSELENASLAGNDNSPMLFANMLGATHWNGYSLSQIATLTDDKTGEYLFNCEYEVNGEADGWRDLLIQYANTAVSSDMTGYIPVDKGLHDLLVGLLPKLSGEKSHENEWLEVCYFFSHYGGGEPVGNPIIGLTEYTAIPVETGMHTADLTRDMAPYPQLIYAFTPSESGVYCFESFIPSSLSSQYAAQIWIYDDNTDKDHPYVYCGDDNKTRDGENEYNYKVYMYMEAGHKYYVTVSFQQMSGTYDFSITRIGNSIDVLTPASGDYYVGVDYANAYLVNAVKYEKDEEGYYHALNADGTRGDYIYLDVKYATAIVEIALSELVDKYFKDPLEGTDLYKWFDLSQSIIYIITQDENGEEVVNYDVVELVKYYKNLKADVYRDYTEDMKAIIAQGLANTGKEDGFVKVNQEIVDILNLFISLRTNGIWNDYLEPAKEDEWLRFCWFYKHYDENNAY